MNPTVFTIEDDGEIVWLVSHRGRDVDANKRVAFIESQIAAHGALYATYYRPGEFWNREVFVCPRCVHATIIELATDGDGWVCKYCDSSWSCSASRGMFRIKQLSHEE